MMKILFFILFLLIMLMFNNKISFFFNLMFLLGLMFLFNFMFKDMIWVLVSLMFFGIDFYSYMLILLSIWVFGLMFMTIQMDFNFIYYKSVKIIVFISMSLILLVFFSSLNLMIFYLMFELSLIPTFIMIIYWGLNYDRLMSSFYMLMYMMLISLPLLLYMMKLYKLNNSFDFNMVKLMLKMNISFWDYLILFFAFYIKLPIYIFHIWLPKAHVEAPVYGSMILASILLKLGSYGLLRFMELFLFNIYEYSYIIFSIGIIGSVAVSLTCLVQVDLKSLVAYSSVVHMNVLMCSMLTYFKVGFSGSYIMMISHGLCSSGLFYMVNLFYERSLSRLLFLNKGLVSLMPSLMLWWFILCMSNLSYPFSLNFMSEVLMISVIISWDKILMLLMMIICFFTSSYSLYLYSYIQHGFIYAEEKMFLVYIKDYLIMILHVFPLVMLILNLSIFN